SFTCDRRSVAYIPSSSVAPTYWPPFAPPPAIQIVKPQGLWSRPRPLSLKGVRPNSPPQTTSVSFKSPRAFRSVSRPEMGLSEALHHLLWLVSTFSWASHPLPDPQYNSTKRTPRSTRRRASRQFWPYARVSSSSMP